MKIEINFRFLKYWPKVHFFMIIMVVILIIGLSTIPFLSSLLIINPWQNIIIFGVFILSWSILIIAYPNLITQGVDFMDEKEAKMLLDFLDKKEVIDYIRDLICLRSITRIKYIGIEIDAKFETNITQKKGKKAGTIRDDWLYKKIEKLYYRIINEC
ncbi:MAG: hypothetical protein ACFFBE_12030 [Promethearchaeota archaeon]